MQGRTSQESPKTENKRKIDEGEQVFGVLKKDLVGPLESLALTCWEGETMAGADV